MTTTIAQQLSYDPELLGLSQVAGQYLQQGEQGLPIARKALELLLIDMKVADPALVRTVTDPKVIEKTLKNQADVYEEHRAQQTVGDMLRTYQVGLEAYLGTEKAAKARAELQGFENQKYGDITRKLAQAEHIIKGFKIGSNTKEEAEAAQKTLTEHQKLMATISILRQARMSAFGQRTETAYAEDALNELYADQEAQK